MSKFKVKSDFISHFLKNKSTNFNVLTKEDLAELVRQVDDARAATSKSCKQRRRTKRFDTIDENGRTRLIKAGTRDAPCYVLPIDDIFDVLDTTHQSSGHGGRDRMKHVLRTKYANITVDMILEFLVKCETCYSKRSHKSVGVVVKPIVQSSNSERVQVDLIDMQSRPDGEFRWILVSQDHFTKLVVLRALRRKTGLDVAEALFDIFAHTGAPLVLHTDNGREFKNKHVKALVEMFANTKMVHGRPRHSQSQGSVERANQDIEKMMACWMRDNNSTKWVAGKLLVSFS
jgi:hypothetical protein